MSLCSCGNIMASGFHLSKDDVYIIADNMLKQNTEAVREKQKARFDYARGLVSHMSRKYNFGLGLRMIFDNYEDYDYCPAVYTKGGSDYIDYFLITQIRYPNDAKADVAADDKRKVLCMNVLRRYGIEGDVSERWCTVPSSHVSCLDWDLARDAARHIRRS